MAPKGELFISGSFGQRSVRCGLPRSSLEPSAPRISEARGRFWLNFLWLNSRAYHGQLARGNKSGCGSKFNRSEGRKPFATYQGKPFLNSGFLSHSQIGVFRLFFWICSSWLAAIPKGCKVPGKPRVIELVLRADSRRLAHVYHVLGGVSSANWSLRRTMGRKPQGWLVFALAPAQGNRIRHQGCKKEGAKWKKVHPQWMELQSPCRLQLEWTPLDSQVAIAFFQ